jgi:Family of unknown function (DUF6328)
MIGPRARDDPGAAGATAATAERASPMLSDFQRNVYLLTVSMSVASTALLIAPVALHRVLFAGNDLARPVPGETFRDPKKPRFEDGGAITVAVTVVRLPGPGAAAGRGPPAETSSKDTELLVRRHEVAVCAAPTRGLAWAGPTEPCSPG